MMGCQKDSVFSRLMPLSSDAITSAPSSAPHTVPCPPSSDVPPMTAAAMASSSIMRPASDVAEPTRAVSTIPATADSSPITVKTPTMCRSMEIPE